MELIKCYYNIFMDDPFNFVNARYCYLCVMDLGCLCWTNALVNDCLLILYMIFFFYFKKAYFFSFMHELCDHEVNCLFLLIVVCLIGYCVFLIKGNFDSLKFKFFSIHRHAIYAK